MSGTAGPAGLYSTIEETARLLDAACSRDKVWPILTTYEDAFASQTPVFRMATGARNARKLDCRFMILNDVDPYALALSNGLTPETDHPVGALLSDLQGRCPVESYGIDIGLDSGFSKTWAFFPADDVQKLSTLADIPSMPRSLAENISIFASHGLDGKVGAIGVDYQHRTVNIYFVRLPAECFEPKAIQSLLREIELPDPSEQMLKFTEQGFGIYPTLSWDSSKIERICYPIITPDPMALPIRHDPRIEHFLRNVPSHNAADHKFIYAIVSSLAGEYYKLSEHPDLLTRRVEYQAANVNAG